MFPADRFQGPRQILVLLPVTIYRGYFSWWTCLIESRKLQGIIEPELEIIRKRRLAFDR